MNRSRNAQQKEEKKPVPQLILNNHCIYTDCSFAPIASAKLVETEINSSLTLQKLIYFNIFYAYMCGYMLLGIYVYKMWTFDKDVYDIVKMVLFFAWLVTEVVRLFNGYTGNIKESFPELISFLLFTIVNLILIIIMISFRRRLPLELGLMAIQIVFDLLEIITSFIVLGRLSKNQTALFFLRSPQAQSSLRKEPSNALKQRQLKKKIDDELQYEKNE